MSQPTWVLSGKKCRPMSIQHVLQPINSYVSADMSVIWKNMQANVNPSCLTANQCGFVTYLNLLFLFSSKHEDLSLRLWCNSVMEYLFISDILNINIFQFNYYSFSHFNSRNSSYAMNTLTFTILSKYYFRELFFII